MYVYIIYIYLHMHILHTYICIIYVDILYTYIYVYIIYLDMDRCVYMNLHCYIYSTVFFMLTTVSTPSEIFISKQTVLRLF